MFTHLKKRHLECSCRVSEHLVVFGWFSDENEPEFQHLYIEVQLNYHLGFWGRLKSVFKYLFKLEDAGWHDTMLLKPEAEKLRDIVNEFIKDCEENENVGK